MNPVEIVVRHAAELDAFGYFQYLREHNPEAALRFLKAIDGTVENLALQPLKGRLISRDEFEEHPFVARG